MKLDREQQHTLAGILSVARKVHAPEKDVISAVETALVEAGLRNPHSPDASSGTSIGWRQETSSSYPNVNRTNVHGAAKRFFAELKKAPGGSTGSRAQAVQRSAYPGRYQQQEGQAKELVKQYGGKLLKGGGSSGGRLTTTTRSVSGVTIPGSPNPVTADTTDLTSLISPTLASAASSIPPPAPLELPNFTARYDLRTPSGNIPQLPESGPIQPDNSISTALQGLQSLGVNANDLVDPLGNSPSIQVPGASVTTQGRSGGSVGSGGGSLGTVKLASGADRGGVSTQPITKKFAELVSGRTHHPIVITTGTNHSRMTVNGNVSDHWTGHAADIAVPVDSHKGDVIATGALEVAGVPASRARAMARHGGLYTITPKSGPLKGKRLQIIWKTYEGGNHHNHVHLGVR